MSVTKKIKRLVIFLFYDKDGIVDSYIPYMLSDIKKNVDNIFFVSNGKVTDEGKEKLKGIADTIFERKNIGFDVWGYKEAIEKIGWDELYKYDEVIFMNYTIMGPVDSFKEMFDTMSKRDLDFWGITKYHRTDFDPWGTIKWGYINDHIQSHFIAVRKKLLTSKEYREYWENMPMIHSYDESVAFHEINFTYTFDKLGYKWDAYVDTNDMKELTNCPILMAPVKIIKERKCPIFKRRSFMHDYFDYISSTAGEHGYELMKYLRENTNYDTNMIYENILRCYDLSTIKDCLQLNYVLSENSSMDENKLYKGKNIALVFHAYFKDLIEESAKYINSMPLCADIYITTDTVEKKKAIEDYFKNNKFHKFEVLLIENRGRDVSALLVATKDFIMDYDYVCFAHDKKVSQIKCGSVGESFRYHCFENLLPTRGFVNNVIETFENNPRLGMLTPMPPIHADYFNVCGNEWSGNYEITKVLADRIGLNVPINKNHPPIAPLGTTFWFRPKGMKKLFDCDWKYEDFPEEPNRIDGTLLHAVERCYGFVEQDAGYYTGWLFSDKGAAIDITNMSYMLSTLNKELINLGIKGKYYSVLNEIKHKFSSIYHLREAGQHFEQAYPDIFELKIDNKIKLYINNGNGFNENATVYGDKTLVEDAKCKFSNLDKYRKIKELRIDPGESGEIILSDVKITLVCKDKKYVVNNDDILTNAICKKNDYLFLDKDPMLIFNVEDYKEISDVYFEYKFIQNPDKEKIVEFIKKSKNSGSNKAISRLKSVYYRIIRKGRRLFQRIKKH